MSNLNCAVNDNRGNSSILIGPRASGKSTLIKQLIEEINQKSDFKNHQIETLRLDGLIFAETRSVLNFLLSKFRSLLSVKNETELEEEEDISEFMAFDQLTALVKRFFAPNIKQSAKKRFVIFVLEDLERFAAHPQQNLLYCLFELALTLPVFVIGTSCRVDVLELLEKRVKSRFSQNIVYLPLPNSREDFFARIQTNLMCSADLYNDSIIEKFLKTNVLYNNLCNFHFDFTKDVRPIFRLLSQTYATIDERKQFDWNTFSELFESVHGPVRPELSLNLSVLQVTLVELMVIVSMCRLAAKYPSIPVTFDVMMDELIGCKVRAPNLEHFKWTKSTIQVAFDRLLSCRLLIINSNNSLNSAASWIDRSYLSVRLGLPIFVILDTIERHPLSSKEIFALACEKF